MLKLNAHATVLGGVAFGRFLSHQGSALVQEISMSIEALKGALSCPSTPSVIEDQVFVYYEDAAPWHHLGSRELPPLDKESTSVLTLNFLFSRIVIKISFLYRFPSLRFFVMIAQMH
jgi:hypothetical protein